MGNCIVIVDMTVDRHTTHTFCLTCWDAIPAFLIRSRSFHDSDEVRHWTAASTYAECEGCGADLLDGDDAG
jgi:hypothetical protein